MTTPPPRSLDHPSSTAATRGRRRSWSPIATALSVALGAVIGSGVALVRADDAPPTETPVVAPAELSAGARPVFVPITPCRLFDTRPGDFNTGVPATPVAADSTLVFTVRGNADACPATIASDAVGLSLNVTAVGATAPTFLTVWGGGDRPDSSSLNPVPGQPPTPNAVNTPLDGNGAFRVFNRFGTVNVIADVVGYYVVHDHDDLYFRQTELYTQGEVDALLAALKTDLEQQIAALPEPLTPPSTTRLSYSTISPLQPDGDERLIQTVGDFTKARSDSIIVLDWATMVSRSFAPGFESCSFHLRLNNLRSGVVSIGMTDLPAVRATVGWASGHDVRIPLSLTDRFTGLPAGTYTVSIWATGADTCTENAGGSWRSVLVTEQAS